MDLAKLDDPRIVGAFETSMIEVELLAHKTGEKVSPVVIAHFMYNVRPHNAFQQEYQKGYVHVGKVEINLRGYAWTDDQINKYKKFKELQDLELMKSVSGSVEAAMDALGEDLIKYLKEAGEKFPGDEKHEEKKKVEKKSALEKVLGDFIPAKKDKKKPKSEKEAEKEIEEARKKAMNDVRTPLYNIWRNFKKAHRMVMW